MIKTLRAALLCGYLRFDEVRAFDAFLAQLRASRETKPCDLCGKTVPRQAPRMLFVHMLTQRVNTHRLWGFCSDLCRERWLGTGTSEDLHPIVPAECDDTVPFRENDGPVYVSVIYDDGPTGGGLGVAVLNPIDGEPVFAVTHGRVVMSLQLDSPTAVNAWWRVPQMLTDGLLDLAFDRRVAA